MALPLIAIQDILDRGVAPSSPMMVGEDLEEEYDDEPLIVDGAILVEGEAKRKRTCRHPGCTKVIKSQGHCQRHGAKAKRCRVDGCDKQAQGTHEGMCKRHFKALHCPHAGNNKHGNSKATTPADSSVYDSVIPHSIGYRPPSLPQPAVTAGEGARALVPAAGFSLMPLVSYLRQGAETHEQGWHRNLERRTRGVPALSSLHLPFDSWERQLILVEILLLSGGTPYANFQDLAFAWGKENDFHVQLASAAVCERHPTSKVTSSGKSNNNKGKDEQIKRQLPGQQSSLSKNKNISSTLPNVKRTKHDAEV